MIKRISSSGVSVESGEHDVSSRDLAEPVADLVTGTTIGRVGIAVANETGGLFGRVDRRLEDEAIGCRTTQRIDALHMDTAASLAASQPNKSGVGYEPAILKLDHISTREREAKLPGQLF